MHRIKHRWIEAILKNILTMERIVIWLISLTPITWRELSYGLILLKMPFSSFYLFLFFCPPHALPTKKVYEFFLRLCGKKVCMPCITFRTIHRAWTSKKWSVAQILNYRAQFYYRKDIAQGALSISLSFFFKFWRKLILKNWNKK